MNSSNTFTVARKKRLDHDKERFELRATSAMQWMAAMLQHDTAIATTYAKVVLAPVFRLVNSERREVSNDLRSLGQELMEMLQTAMDSGGAEDGTFFTLHEEVRTRVMDTKLDRKRKRAQQKINDPKAAAVYKMHRKDAKKRNRDKKKMSNGHHKKRRRRRGNEDIL